MVFFSYDVLQLYYSSVILFFSYTVLQLDCSSVIYCSSVILFFCYTVLQLYCSSVIPFFSYTVLQLCCYAVIMLYLVSVIARRIISERTHTQLDAFENIRLLQKSLRFLSTLSYYTKLKISQKQGL
jgi:hypothetical protein